MARTSRLSTRVRILGSLIVLAGGLTLVPVSASATDGRASSNNNFANAWDVGTNNPASWTQNTGGNTTEAGEPTFCDVDFGATVWYRMTVVQRSTVTVDTRGSDFDTVMAVYTGNAVGALTRVDCNDDLGGIGDRDSEVAFTAEAGTVYYIQIGGFDNGGGAETGALKFHAARTVTSGPQSNDMFAGAKGVGTTTSWTQSTVGATWEAGENLFCDGNPMGATVWYWMSVTQQSTVTLDTSGSNYDTLLSVYTGNTVGSLNRVVCNDDVNPPGDLTSEVVFTAQPGTVYYVQIGGLDGAHGIDAGNLKFHIASDAIGGGGDPDTMCEGFAADFVGTNGNDVIRGTPGDDVIVGLGGNDRIYGKGGSDIICAGPGNDRVKGGSGSDWILGEEGNDVLKGGKGGDDIFGGDGDDIIRGQKGHDYLNGNGGYDVVRGNRGIDECVGENVRCEL